ncbi:MAG: hypothetical protein GWP91_16790 [Rhodobacterales bacterium]|nr:hypothetical protein [Rhodobacterales bacterium]
MHRSNGTVSFRALRCFNDPNLRPFAGKKGRIDERTIAFLAKDNFTRRVCAALAHEGLLPLKEVCESFEFFERVRRAVRAPVVADLAAGHGLTGLLFAVFERKVESVVLVDTHPPPSHIRVLDALSEVAPWIRPKVHWVTGSIEEAHTHLEKGTSIVAVHACGDRTDRCLDVARSTGGHLAVMPCCYHKRVKGPDALFQALGEGLATDIHRTYRLEAAGYRVRWSRIPEVITPMNRVIIAQVTAPSP